MGICRHFSCWHREPTLNQQSPLSALLLFQQHLIKLDSLLSYSPSDQDVDEVLDDAPLEQLYARNWTHDAEDYEEYRPGGFHPVHIGDRFGTAGQFRVIHKLGRGGLATVWLCRDGKAQRYVALKIILADESREDSPELALVKRKLDYGEAGGEFIAVPHEHFWHHGPNGRHLCLVLPVLGPRVTAVWNSGIRAVFAPEEQVRVSQDVALQVALGCDSYTRTEFATVIFGHLTFFSDL
ncbi:hypothetical protein HYALB_00001780 [Hymenoscyphus albidus]|uniref:non-specific serine/threonine protein kinase n=1 Tax=Hymenoscyphus albidus TaxID=595503 RepID=A0A9N9LST3_9HELO|nr:hypothetical protein HYALB_00001780 [Hymenoscyphus albidus]